MEEEEPENAAKPTLTVFEESPSTSERMQLPEKPEKPLDSDCCGRGCSPCVFDLYEQDLAIWERDCALIQAGIDPSASHHGESGSAGASVYVVRV
jgi:hypothetical protein